MPMKLAFLIGATVVAAGLAAYLAGVRIFVIQPIGALPDGVTAVVSGVSGLNFIDSPDSFCEREQGYVNLMCRGVVAGKVAKEGNILLRLPYSDFMYSLTGAPETDR